MIIRPQPGFQTAFLSTSADIAIGGGSAGCGKTYASVIEPLRNMPIKGFGGVIFRRTYPQITNEGGLWDTTVGLYPALGLKPNESTLDWTNNLGNKIKFSHLQYEKNMYDWQGSQIPYIGYDELTHFSEKMFFYLLSRNRSVCGVKPYVRATCNPDPDSWVRRLIDWWIDPVSGFPIVERSAKLRFFARHNGAFFWGNSKQEVLDICPGLLENPQEGINPFDLIKSLTFIPGSIYENKALLKVDPGYLGNLQALDEQSRSQLLDGNWNIKADPTSIYNSNAINDLYTNTHVAKGKKYITVDAARFGSDLCVIWVWEGFWITDCLVLDISSTSDIANAVKAFEKQYGVPRSQTICDADGVGGGVIDQCPGMNSFINNAKPVEVKGSNEQYENMKTQCYYRSADRVNSHEVYIEPRVADMAVQDGTVKQKLNIQLRSIKRDKPDNDGKKKIIPKAQIKAAIGCSPDFADSFSMREWFEIEVPQNSSSRGYTRKDPKKLNN